MKTYSKAELIEKSKEVFEFNKNEDQLIAISDGQFFLSKAKSLAIDYANKNGLQVHTIDKDEKVAEEPKEENLDKPKLAADLIESINASKTLEELKTVLPEGEKRKTVKEAYEVKLKELEVDPEASSENTPAEGEGKADGENSKTTKTEA